MKVFTLPDLGEGLQEAEIVSWHVATGDHVVADQPLVAVETEKAVVEVPSPQAGRIARVCAQIGDHVKVGAPLVEFEEGPHADPGTVVGQLTSAAATEPPLAAPSTPTGMVKAMPAARALARQRGIDLALVAPSGPGGTVTLADVERAAAGTATVAQPLKGVRRAMAQAMARSGAAVVPATVVDDADVDAWAADADVTVRLVRAVVAGCVAAPELNAWFDGATLERRLHARIDLGVATDTEDGLFVPVLRDVGARDAVELRRGLDALKRDVRARAVPIADMRGQTFTVSNFGMLAGRYAALTIVPPQVGILGAGRMVPRVVAVDGKPVVRRLLPLSLTFDHRAVTGAEAARFLAAAITDLARAT